MSKRIPFLFFIILIMLVPLPWAEALGIGPPSFEMDLQMDGSNSTTVYLLSDGLEGELIIGRENLSFRVDPSRINMSKEDNYRPVELTFYGNGTLEPGGYEGFVTFVAQTGGFVALGIRIRAKINLLATAQVREEEEPETHDEEEEPEKEEPEIESEDAVLDEDEGDTGNPLYLIGGLALCAIMALGLIRIWWARR